MSVIKGRISAGIRITGSINGGGAVKGLLDKALSVYVRELEFNNRFEFPSIGKADMLYIALDEKAVYIFDGEQNIYRCVGRNYEEIEIIQGI